MSKKIYRGTKYKIGFTENHYSIADDEDNYATERRASSTTLSFDRAERFNKGKESNQQSQFAILEKKKGRSVQKMHQAFLDVLYEMAEKKRKQMMMSPTFKTLDLSRSSSGASLDSLHSSVKSLPCLENSGASFLGQSSRSLPNIPHQRSKSEQRGNISFLDLHEKTLSRRSVDDQSLPVISKEQIGVVTQSHVVADTRPVTQHEQVRSSNVQRQSKSKGRAQTQPFPGKRPKKRGKNTGRFSSINVQASGHSSLSIDNGRQNLIHSRERSATQPPPPTVPIEERPSPINGSKKIYKVSVTRPPESSENSRSVRLEKERMNNIRRRYAAQTKSGPIDFHKLQRQIISTKAM